MKTKIKQLISQYKKELRILKEAPEDCTREKLPVLYGKVQELKKVILDLEWILSNSRDSESKTTPKQKT